MNHWLWFSIFGTVALFVFGIYMIDTQFGNHDIQFALRDTITNLSIVGRINCTDNNDHILFVDEEITCSIPEPILKNTTTAVGFVYKNGSVEHLQIDNLTFKAPENVEYIMFDVFGFDENNTKRYLTIGDSYEFLTKARYEEKRNNFISALVLLIPIVIFSVPAAIDNWKSLIKDN